MAMHLVNPRRSHQSEDSTTMFYILAFFMLVTFTYGIVQDLELKLSNTPPANITEIDYN